MAGSADTRPVPPYGEDRPYSCRLALLLAASALAAAGTALAGVGEVRSFTGHKDYVLAVAFSPDSRYLASASYDGTAILWETATGKRIRSFIGHSDSVVAAAFSPDGKLLATGGFDGTAKLWEISTGNEILSLSGHTDWVMSVAFHPDSAWLATGSYDGTAKLWDLRTGQEVRTLLGHRGGVNAVAFSPDGKFMATASDDKTAKLWNALSGEEIRTYQGHRDAVRAVAFSPDGALLATGSNDRTARVWDVITRKDEALFTGHKGWVFGVAFSTEGRYLATCSGDETIKLWELETGNLVETFSGHKEGVNGIAFSPNGWYLASGSDDNTAKLWPIPFQPIRRLPPNLSAALEFNDENGDGILEATESGRLHFILRNEGRGPAQRVRVTVEDDLTDPCLTSTSQSVRAIGPGGRCDVTIMLRADMGVRTAQHRLRISVREYYGYDMDPVYLLLTTKAINPPTIGFSGIELIDSGPDVAAIAEDGRLQPGESAKVKVLVQNTGLGIARGITYSVYTTDPNIYLGNSSGTLGDFKPGEVKAIMLGVSPNKRVVASSFLPIYLTIRDRIGMIGLTNIQLPLELGKVPPKPVFTRVIPESSQARAQLARFEFSSPRFSVIPGQDIAVAEVESSLTKMPATVAVVFGIEHYREIPDAVYAASSAQLMLRYLQTRLGVGRAYSYLDQEASGLIFDEAFNPDNGRLLREVKRGFTDVLVYYRGRLVANRAKDEIYLFPADGRTEKLEIDGYPLSTLYGNLGKLGARSVTVILDAAVAPKTKSSMGTRGQPEARGLKLRNPKPWTSFPAFSALAPGTGEETVKVSETGFTVINACEGYEHAAGYEPAELGLFTYYLAAGLKGSADGDGDRRVTLGELRKYLVENVAEKSWRISGLQVPEAYGDDGRILVEW